MNIVLLSGGSGKRLWPLSNDIRSKQFIKIFKKPSGKFESMVQRIYGQIKSVDPGASVTIATSKSQVSAIHNQLGMDIGLSVEPCRRDTFAAIALATAYLHDIKNVPSDEAVVVCPVDPYVEQAYFECIKQLYETAKGGDKRLVLMGIQPTYPSEKYGYIKPVKKDNGENGYAFTEKPTEEKAREYIEAGALWNGGVFAYKLSYVLDKARDLLGTDDYDRLLERYSELKKISFDYAVVEAEDSIEVIKYSGEWRDLGTWNTLTEVMDDPIIGDAVLNEACENVNVINELDIPILGMGLKDVVISASAEGILVSDKGQSSYIKPYVDAIDSRVMFAEKSWGAYRVIDIEDDSMTVKVTLNPRNHMNYHSHERRDEIWNVVAGSGRVIVEGTERFIKPGDTVSMPAGCKHTVIAGENGIQLIEVQMGRDIDVSDKRKFEMP